ncbi:hypothetical protein RJ641_015904 [Dillenia turbinata]|uniref:Uncharacterized protein n=1 Tax=Dillenia turbinata TaxID=194707 RepID=A0AAN8UQT6_9MAGN
MESPAGIMFNNSDVSKMVGEKGSLLGGRGAILEDVAHATIFLASEEAGFITGHNLVVDGSYTPACSNMKFIYQA